MTKLEEVKQENGKLKVELEELKTAMQKLLESQKTTNQNLPKVDFNDDSDLVQLIEPNRLVQITSLYNGGMTLTGGNNKKIRFENFGMTLPVTFEDLTHICSNHRGLAETGHFFIHNKEAIKSLYLTESYKHLINKQTIEDFITLPDNEIRDIYATVTDEIKETIVELIIDGVKRHLRDRDMKFSNREKIDLIGVLANKDIYKIAKDAVEEEQKNKG